MAPTDIVLSTVLYPPLAGASSAFATLTAVDPNCCDTYTFSVVCGASAALFTVIGNQLSTVGNVTGNGHVIVIRVIDTAGGMFDKTVTLNEGLSRLWPQSHNH